MQCITDKTYEKQDQTALRKFFQHCQQVAKKKDQPQMASISLEVKYIDPLAVLESIYEPKGLHFYLEHPASEEAVAGAEAILQASFHGENRFEQVREFAKTILENTIMIGDMNLPFTGPHFFTTFTFSDEVEKDGAFPAAQVFVPRWQVARKCGVYSAVANVLVTKDVNVDSLMEKVWNAHRKFNTFDYDYVRNEEVSKGCSEILNVTEVGGSVWYKNAVKKAIHEVDKNLYKKIVLARAVDLKADRVFHPLSTLNRLREQYPVCFSCSVGNGEGKSFIAAAPERLLKVAEKTIFTEAVAGSAPRGKTAQEDAFFGKNLLDSDKDLREHNFVVDFIVKQLKDLRLELKVSAKPRLKKLVNVQHLNSPIKANLIEGIHILDVARKLHPTPAVSGTPLDTACKGIKEIENFDRGLYAGTIGWFDYKGDGEYVVGIRSALIDGINARLYAGCGIVRGSDPETEFQETDMKLQAMLENLR